MARDVIQILDAASDALIFSSGGLADFQRSMWKKIQEEGTDFIENSPGWIYFIGTLAQDGRYSHTATWRKRLEKRTPFEFGVITKSVPCPVCARPSGYLYNNTARKCWNCDGTKKVNAQSHVATYDGETLEEIGDQIR